MYFNIVHGKKDVGLELGQTQPVPAAWDWTRACGVGIWYASEEPHDILLYMSFLSTYIVNIRVHFRLIIHLFHFIIKK